MPGMLTPQHYAEDGYAQAGYFAPWAPPAGLKNVNHADMSFDLRRLPTYPEFEIDFGQWRKTSGGGLLSVGDPYDVRLYQINSWPAMPVADLNNWLTFFHSVARAQSEPWEWFNPAQGNSVPVRFADSTFPDSPEIGYGNHQVNSLRLMMDINYPAMVAAGSPAYTAAMGTCFAIGSVVVQLPPPVRPGTGNNLAVNYLMETASDGNPVVYRTAHLARRTWKLSWSTLRRVHWVRLQSFFMTWVRGMKQAFTWYDYDGTPRTVRLAEPKISVKQLGYDRYSCDLSLLEDL